MNWKTSTLIDTPIKAHGDGFFFSNAVHIRIGDDGLEIACLPLDRSLEWDLYTISGTRPQIHHLIIPIWGVALGAGVFDWLDHHGIAVSFLTREHRISHTIWPQTGLGGHGENRTRLSLKRRQYGLPWEDGLPYVRRLLMKKVTHSLANLGRAGAAPEVCEDLLTVRDLIGLEVYRDRLELMALEGRASSLYWGAVSQWPLKWKGTGKAAIRQLFPVIAGRAGTSGNRMAVTPFHAMLNYVCGVALARLRIAVVVAGLDADVGFFHADDDYRENLLWDLLELMRGPIEAKLITLACDTGLRADGFDYTKGGYPVRVGPALRIQLVSDWDGWLRDGAWEAVMDFKTFLMESREGL